jgi:hypothetical protein
MTGAADDPPDAESVWGDVRPNREAVKPAHELSELPVGASPSLPPEVTTDAAGRLGSLGLVYSCGVLFGYFGRRALLTWSGAFQSGLSASDVIAFAAILMGLAVLVASRRRALPPEQLVNLGLAFQVAGALGIAGAGYWHGVPPPLNVSLTLLPSECAWIIVYPLVVPNTPFKVLASSFLAASMGAMLVISAAVSRTEIVAPATVAGYLLQEYLSAVAAYAVARIVHRFNVRLKHARDIGSYELIEPVAEGGMGEVWRACHRLLARPAALKLIRKESWVQASVFAT